MNESRRIGSTFANGFLGYAFARSGQKAEAENELHALFELSKQRYVPPYHIALIYKDSICAPKLSNGLSEVTNKEIPKWSFSELNQSAVSCATTCGFRICCDASDCHPKHQEEEKKSDAELASGI